jgi:hypothetical protein
MALMCAYTCGHDGAHVCIYEWRSCVQIRAGTISPTSVYTRGHDRAMCAYARRHDQVLCVHRRAGMMAPT